MFPLPLLYTKYHHQEIVCSIWSSWLTFLLLHSMGAYCEFSDLSQQYGHAKVFPNERTLARTEQHTLTSKRNVGNCKSILNKLPSIYHCYFLKLDLFVTWEDNAAIHIMLLLSPYKIKKTQQNAYLLRYILKTQDWYYEWQKSF